MVPASEQANLAGYWRDAMRSRVAFWWLFAGVVGGFLVGAALRDPRVMIAAPLGAVLLVVLWAYSDARSRASHDFWAALAPSLGLLYLGETGIQPLTPLLAAGDRRRFEHTMGGEIAPGLQGMFSHYTYEVRHDTSWGPGENDDEAWTRYDYTVCAFDLVPSMPYFPGVFLRPKRGLFENRHNWLKRLGCRTVELESIALNERYEVLASHDQDEAAVRELLSPKLIDWLARHPLAPGLELRAGALTVYLPGHVAEAGKLTFFLDGVRHVLDAAQRQVDEVRAEV
jgi:hypothetical protein